MNSNWRERQKQELTQQLYSTALGLFSEHGYENTTVKQITDAVGVAKGTFFNHFPTKEHVVEEWYHGITFDCLDAARQRRDPSAGAEATVCDLCVDMARRAAAQPEMLAAKARHSSNPLLEQAERVQDDEIDTFLLEVCQDGQKRGELDADLDAPFFVGVVGAVLTGTSREWVLTGQLFDFPTLVRQRLHFVFKAAKA